MSNNTVAQQICQAKNWIEAYFYIFNNNIYKIKNSDMGVFDEK